MIFNILDNTTELWMTKYIIGEIFSSSRATLYKSSDQTVRTIFPHFLITVAWRGRALINRGLLTMMSSQSKKY